MKPLEERKIANRLKAKRRREANPEGEKALRRKYYRQMVARIFELLDGVCSRCGNEDKRLLQIDHINGGGSQHRKTANRSWRRLCNEITASIEAGHEEFRLLCANCNWLVAIENGHRKSIWGEQYLETL